VFLDRTLYCDGVVLSIVMDLLPVSLVAPEG
jgi:hypothetical protein